MLKFLRQSLTHRRLLKDSFFLILICIATELPAQWQQAVLTSADTVQMKQVDLDIPAVASQRAASPTMKPGFPRWFPADPAFKNFRNVTLEDLDADGRDEIIAGIANTLYVLKSSEIWWSYPLTGLARFPVAIGDLEGDLTKEIVVLTGYNQEPGGVYVLDARGEAIPGWPRDFDGRWMISSPMLADMDQHGTLEILCSDLFRGSGRLHVLKPDGSEINEHWPLALPQIPAVTPSVGDINGDGLPDIVVTDTRNVFALNLLAEFLEGWPPALPNTKFSYQSPLILQWGGEQAPSILLESHGDQPFFLHLNALGEHLPGWPIAVPQNSWTFHTPTVIQYQDETYIFTARPIGAQPADMLYAWSERGNLHTGFPLVKAGGLEGLITVADIDEQEGPELIFPSNLIADDGYGFIHAYALGAQQELAGFPVRPRGLTYLNGATLGDIDGDAQLDMVVLSYTEYPDRPDSVFITAYDLGVPAVDERIWWSTYKGNNLRNGLVSLNPGMTTDVVASNPASSFKVFPNPATDRFTIQHRYPSACHLDIIDATGKILQSVAIPTGQTHQMPLPTAQSGLVFLRLSDTKGKLLGIHKIVITAPK